MIFQSIFHSFGRFYFSVHVSMLNVSSPRNTGRRLLALGQNYVVVVKLTLPESAVIREVRQR